MPVRVAVFDSSVRLSLSFFASADAFVSALCRPSHFLTWSSVIASFDSFLSFLMLAWNFSPVAADFSSSYVTSRRGFPTASSDAS